MKKFKSGCVDCILEKRFALNFSEPFRTQHILFFKVLLLLFCFFFLRISTTQRIIGSVCVQAENKAYFLAWRDLWKAVAQLLFTSQYHRTSVCTGWRKQGIFCCSYMAWFVDNCALVTRSSRSLIPRFYHAATSSVDNGGADRRENSGFVSVPVHRGMFVRQ